MSEMLEGDSSSKNFRNAMMQCVSSYFKIYSPLRHQIETYNYFIECQIPQIIEEYKSLIVDSENKKIRHCLEFTHMRMTKPQITESDGSVRNIGPKEIIDRKLTYDAKILINITHKIFNRNECVEGDPQSNNGTLTHSQTFQQVELCTIPVMVGSKFCHTQDRSAYLYQHCPSDVLGYFIINGNEKTIVAQERLRPNYAYVSFIKRCGKTFYQCEIRSWNETKLRSTSTLYISLTQPKKREDHIEIKFSVPFIENVPISLINIFKLLDITDISIIQKYLLGNDEYSKILEPIIRSMLMDETTGKETSETSEGKTNEMETTERSEREGKTNEMNANETDQLYEWIGAKATKQKLLSSEKRKKAIIHIFNNEFLPHIGLGDPSKDLNKRKAIYISYAVRKLLLVSQGYLPPDDRDHYVNKRLHCTGILMAYQFRQLLIQYIKSVTLTMQKAIKQEVWIDAVDATNPKLITAGFKYAMSRGKWGLAKGGSTQDGVVQVLVRMNPQSTIGHGRRINTPLNRDGKIPKPRQLNVSHRGIICNIETPEGESCGLLKNLALLTHVRLGSTSKIFINLLTGFKGVSDIIHSGGGKDPLELFNKVWIFINGNPLLLTDDPETLVEELRYRRRNDDIPFDTSIIYNSKLKHIWIYSDMGCCVRPVMLCNKIADFWKIYNQYQYDPYLWMQLRRNHIIDYIDKEEEEYNTTIANTMKDLSRFYTHIELDPTFIMGISALTIPFPDHNQAPRNIYGTTMARQSIGVPSTRHHKAFDTAAHVLDRIERPLVSTQTAGLTPYYELPSGQNIILAIMSMTFNQEDSLIVNKRSIDNGLFRSVAYRSYLSEERVNGSEREEFGVPNAPNNPPNNNHSAVTQMQNANYNKLNEYGFMDIGTKIEAGDAIIGKIMNIPTFGKQRNKKEISKIDKSIILHPNEPTVMDKILITSGREGNTIIRCKTRSIRIPEIGDKFSNTSGQKGTVGIILPPEDMPFSSKDGLIPDFIINPHCIPSRMTIGLLMEMALGKVCAAAGYRGNATAFNEDFTVDDIGEQLHSYGFERYGSECMIDGRTGKMYKARIYIGIAYYYKLRHMVIDKMHARFTGPHQFLTRQPVEGRSRSGGLKFGEMEHDSLVAHGASKFLQDRLCTASDAYIAYICNQCGFFAAPPHQNNPNSIISNLLQNGAFCHSCGTGEYIKQVTIPYAYKLLHQEFLGCQLGLKHYVT